MADENLGKRVYGPDDEPQRPKTGFEKFRGTPPALIIGIVLGVLVGIVCMYAGVYLTCFFLGYLIIALMLYYIPKIFGVEKLKWQAIVAVLFFICSTCFGALVVTPDAMHLDEYKGGDQFSSEGFTELTYEESTTESGTLVFSVVYKEGYNGKVGIVTDQVNNFHYINKSYWKNTQFFHSFSEEPRGDGKSVYKINVKMVADNIYKLGPVIFKETASDKNDVDGVFYAHLFEYKLTEQTKKNKIWMGNSYQTAIVTGVFIIVCLLMYFMNKSLASTRAKLEAEGRLYPQGYGRCKECGTMVLPGETCCRKCGAYVDIPEEMRVKKVDSFHCSECGAEVPANSLTCPRCGAKFDEDDEVVIVDKDGNESTTIDMDKQSEEKPVENKEEEKKE